MKGKLIEAFVWALSQAAVIPPELRSNDVWICPSFVDPTNIVILQPKTTIAVLVQTNVSSICV
jgi:hypothetical protein